MRRFRLRAALLVAAVALLGDPIATLAQDTTRSRFSQMRVVADPASRQGAGPGVSLDQIEADSSFDIPIDKARHPRDPLVPVILKYASPPLASYEGGITGLAATSPTIVGGRLNPWSLSSQAYLRHLGRERQRVEQLARAAAPGARIGHDLSVVVGGLAVQVPRSELDRLRAIPGVEVYPDDLQQPDMYRSPGFVGAPAAWSALGGTSKAGEGIVIGVIDTGIWPEHPSFADPDRSGRPYPAPPASWTGSACDFGASGGPPDAPFACNRKLVGARRVMATYEAFSGVSGVEFRSARDDDGHGTHTATIAAGNFGVEAAIRDLPLGTISGIAPRAHVAVYKVCGERGCYTSDSAAAVQQAILDGVDVINYSISGGANPYADIVSLAFLDAYNAGVFVATSAGNTGPSPGTVNHRGPWVTTVASVQHDRTFRNELSVFGTTTLTLTGASITTGLGLAAPIVVNPADPLCLEPARPGRFTGQVVVCRRGVVARVAKSFNVAAGGAVGLVLYNVLPGESLDLDPHAIPTSHIDADAGHQLIAFLAAHPDATASMTDPSAAPTTGDVLATSSARGGPGLPLGVLKPDLSAPGVAILSGYTSLAYGQPAGPFSFLSGTSMASPHVAGAAALLMQRYPSWTPGQIKSALMTTANPAVTLPGSPAPGTPFDVGAGRVDLAQATHPGITFSAAGSDFLTFQPNLSVVNQPSVFLPANPGRVTIFRVAQNTMKSAKVWRLTVSADHDVDVLVPPLLVALPGRATPFPITLDVSRLAVGAVAHARLALRTLSGRHEATLPISVVRRDGQTVVTKVCDTTYLPVGGSLACDVSFSNTGLRDAAVTVRDVLPREFVLTGVTGPAGTTRVHARKVRFDGMLAGGSLETFTVAPGSSPAGYLPLSGFGIAPIGGVGDETIINFTVAPFVFNGQVYTRIGVVSNGYIVVGGGTGADVQMVNRAFPDPMAPNNVLAPFWTDLDLSAGGALRIATLANGPNRWLVVDWQNVPNYGEANTNSFQVWIGLNGAEDITFTYGAVTPGAGGYLTVGAENATGLAGATYYHDGDGPAPASGTVLRVSTAPGGPGETQTFSFTARAVQEGEWTGCAELASPVLFGIATACVSGAVTPR